MISGTTQVTAPLAPTSLIDLYPTHDSIFGLDGLRNVATLSDRNAIPDLRRRAGMIVGVLADDTYWRLKNVVWNGTNSDWELFVLGDFIPNSEKGAINGVATLDGSGKIPVAQLASSVMQYQGQWNATTNSPTLADGTGDIGDVWEVTVAGSQDLGSGSITFKVGDWVVYNGTNWECSTNSGEVVSVNGLTGAVTLTTSNIAEGSNLYYTDARVDDYLVLVDALRGTVAQNQIAYGDSSGDLQGNANFLFDGTNMSIGLALASATLHVKGLNSTSSNYSLKVNNSSNAALFYVRNDGFVSIGGTTIEAAKLEITAGSYQGIYVTSSSIGINAAAAGNGSIGILAQVTSGAGTSLFVRSYDASNVLANFVNSTTDTIARMLDSGYFGIGTSVPTAMLHSKGNDSTSANYALKIDNSLSTNLFHVRNDGFTKIFSNSGQLFGEKLQVGGTILVASAGYLINDGNGSDFWQIYAGSRTLNFTASGLSPILTIDVNSPFYITTHSAYLFGIGIATPTAKLNIKGSDSTSSNYALKIQDSNLAELFYVRNDGNITVKQDPTVALGVATKQYVDNSISSAGGMVDISYASLATLKSVNGLVKGKSYRITNRFTGYTEGDDRGVILVQAIDTNVLAKEAIRIMYCPSFYDASIDTDGNDWIGIWHITKFVTAGQLCIWGGRVWENLTGSIGTSVDSITLDGTNWSLIDKSTFSNNEYTDIQFSIFYDFDNDWIDKQWDKSGNIVGIDNYTYINGSITYNPCDVTDWNFIAGRETSGGYFLNENNVPYGIFNNTSNIITDNTCAMIEGIRENTASQITYNNAFGIYENVGQTEISKNYLGYIYQNINSGKITANYIGRNEISNNGTDVVDILANTNSGGITGNNNTGHIKYNHNLGSIYDNENLGDISNNTDEIQDITNLTTSHTKMYKNQLTNDTISGNQVFTCSVVSNGIDLSTYAPYLKKVYIISSGGTETVNYIYAASLPKNNKVILEVKSGLIVTFTHGTGTDEPRLEGAANMYINGTYGEWIEIEKTDSDVVRQSNIATYI